MKRTPRPRDPVQLGKLMVDIMTGKVSDAVDDGKSKGVTGGKIGGQKRAEVLTSDQRSGIAREAAFERWKKR